MAKFKRRRSGGMGGGGRGFAAKYLPRPALIPAILVIGGLGAVMLAKAFPKLVAAVATKTPQIQKTA